MPGHVLPVLACLAVFIHHCVVYPRPWGGGHQPAVRLLAEGARGVSFERGRLSHALIRSRPIFLGEISFAFHLLHILLLRVAHRCHDLDRIRAPLRSLVLRRVLRERPSTS